MKGSDLKSARRAKGLSRRALAAPVWGQAHDSFGPLRETLAGVDGGATAPSIARFDLPPAAGAMMRGPTNSNCHDERAQLGKWSGPNAVYAMQCLNRHHGCARIQLSIRPRNQHPANCRTKAHPA